MAASGFGSAPAGLADCCVRAGIIVGISAIRRIRMALYKKVTTPGRQVPTFTLAAEFSMDIAPILLSKPNIHPQVLINAVHMD